MSETVSNALVLVGGDEAIETAKFVSMFDNFFDLLNVQNFTTGARSRKPFQHPYRSSDDFRLAVRNKQYYRYLHCNLPIIFTVGRRCIPTLPGQVGAER